MTSSRFRLILSALLSLVLLGGAPLIAADSPAGGWKGAIELPGSRLEVSVLLTETDGSWSGAIDIPAQGASGLPLIGVEVQENTVRFTIGGVPGEPTFSGTLAEDAITGDFTQGGQRFDFKLEPGVVTTIERKPAPEEEEVGEILLLDTERGTLNGRLTTPESKLPLPVVLMIAGSGPTDRNGNNPAFPGKNNMLQMLASELGARSIASVRFDKRGVAGSAAAGIPEVDLRFGDFVDDASRWVRLLQGDERFSRVIVLGHSEGSLIGMLATMESKADAYISVAGPGRPAYELIEVQLSVQPEAIQNESSRVLKELRAGRTVADSDPVLAALYRPTIQPYLISWFKYDPAQVIAQLEVPTMIVQGTTDIQVPVSEGNRLYAAKPGADYKVIEGMNHVLKTAPADRAANFAAYSDPALPLTEGLVETLAKFIGKTDAAPAQD